MVDILCKCYSLYSRHTFIRNGYVDVRVRMQEKTMFSNRFGVVICIFVKVNIDHV